MTGPNLQYVVTSINRKGEECCVTVGYSTRAPGNPEESMVCVVGDNSGLPHISWNEFKKTSDDLTPQFVSEVRETLRKASVRKAVTMFKRTRGKKTVITITIEEQ